MLPPPVSKYARYPDDIRLVREWIKWYPSDSISALYAGPAYGEDLFSWLGVSINTGHVVRWTALDIDSSVCATLRMTAPAEICVMQGDALTHSTHYDLIIAYNIWSGDADANRPMLDNLIRNTEGMLIARGTQMELPGWWGHVHETIHPILIKTNRLDPINLSLTGPVNMEQL